MNKRITAIVAIFMFLIFMLFSSCKLELPDDVADDSAIISSFVKTSEVDNSSSDDVGLETNLQGYVSSANNASEEQNKNQLVDISNSSTILDKYKTQPVPEGKPKPVEPTKSVESKTQRFTCTLSITCKTILNNMNDFNKDKLEVLPQDGVIYTQREVSFLQGESVFDVLLRETKKNRIHMEFKDTPIYNSAYIQGINNIYEFDCKDLSGWMYKVNGWFPNYGSSRYQLKDGDIIDWVYTCDLGRDVGDNYWLDNPDN